MISDAINEQSFVDLSMIFIDNYPIDVFFFKTTVDFVYQSVGYLSRSFRSDSLCTSDDPKMAF